MTFTHSFHIPVMGIGFTIDSPLKVARYGIDSVISLGDDMLMEKLRKVFAHKYNLPFTAIEMYTDDYRARRITAYLNLIHHLVKSQIEHLKNIAIKGNDEWKRYIELLPDNSAIKASFNKLTASSSGVKELQQWVKSHLSPGSIDVNIMTKVDKENYKDGKLLPAEYNDAHAALRGFAYSDLNASVVFSAGMNPRLYGYAENFDDFYPDGRGILKKRIILKVSDYRSAFIQGKFLAKKGLWVSEYRIESGLNCGGHAFATDGYLLGPVLEQFKNKRNDLQQTLHELLIQSLTEKGKPLPGGYLPLKISAQGGVGSPEEHAFLLDYYKLDSIGWGSPFLLVPEATTVDEPTMAKLAEAGEADIYLSNISPLGIPFNNLRGNTKDEEKQHLINKGKPGSPCPKKYLSLNKSYTEKALCTASRKYQHLSIQALNKDHLPDELYQQKYAEIVDKSCICVGLGTSALLVHGIETKKEGDGVSICPGPNMAYFNRQMKLKELVDFIYGKKKGLTNAERPHMFIKELALYYDHLYKKLKEATKSGNEKQLNALQSFAKNLQEGVGYYIALFTEGEQGLKDLPINILAELNQYAQKISTLHSMLKESKVGI